MDADGEINGKGTSSHLHDRRGTRRQEPLAGARRVPGAQIVALVDPVAEVLAATGDEFGIEARFTSLEEALDKVAFDAVVITTPTFTHRDLALTAAAHGKHVFLEKPMALNLAECDAIIEGTRRVGVILQIGFMRRFSPEFVAATQRIEAGEIGRPMMIKSLTHGPGPAARLGARPAHLQRDAG